MPGSSSGLRAVGEVQRHAAAGQGADQQLALGADVPDVGPEAHRQPHRAEHQRRGLEEQLGDAVQRP